MTPDELTEYDFDSIIKAFENLKKAISEMADALKKPYLISELRKWFEMTNVGESNNYLKYHGRPMKRRRWIK